MFGLFNKAPADPAPGALYREIVKQARLPIFYQELGVADTPDGRFDMVAIHAWLVLRRLRAARDQTADLSQALFDVMFDDMDRNLRELGVGDLAVGKRIKGMAQGFYGRVASYDSAVDGGDIVALGEALRRNAYRANQPEDDQVMALARYVLDADRALSEQAIETLMAGSVAFLTPVPEPDGQPAS